MPAVAATRTVEAPGCTLTYDVRGDLSGGMPLFAFGSPMEAAEFAALVERFDDRPVVTYDPRGAGRSPRTDGGLRTEVAEHADDLRRVIDALGVDQIDLLASSGGAVNALALAAAHTPRVRIVVAHEPPAATALPDRDEALALATALHDTYTRHGFGRAMAKFIESVMIAGPIPEGYARQPGPDPAAFGLPTEDDGGRDDPLLGLNMPACLEYEHDPDALRSAPSRVVLAYAAESAEQMPGRAARALAEQTGLDLVEFPSHHGGFVASDHPMMPGQPDAFAARLREVLDGDGADGR